MTIHTFHQWINKAKAHQKTYKQFLQKTSRSQILPKLQSLHNEAFRKINCLTCANCCTNHSPRFKMPDIKRIARYLKIKEVVFIRTYLTLDDDGDYVVEKLPCPFLGKDNACSIYNVRPSDCARYPYTNEDVLIRRPLTTLTNSTICPAVYYVLEKLIQPSSTNIKKCKGLL